MTRDKVKFDYFTAFKRNLGLISREEQEKIRAATVAIPGLGGVGGIHMITLARLGIGGFHIADKDSYDLGNFNRQYGATMETIGKSKVEVMQTKGLEINPELRLKCWNDFISEENAEDFLRGADIIVDSLDAFSVQPRHQLFAKARAMNIPVVSAGPLGFGCVLVIFDPKGMSFDEYVGYEPSVPPMENFLRFIAGMAPEGHFLEYMDLEKISAAEQAGPSLSSAVTLCAAIAGTEILKILLNRGTTQPAPHYHFFDPYLMRFKSGLEVAGAKSDRRKKVAETIKKAITRP